MADLPVDLLRTFATIADTGSYTRAAGLLFRTQPALSLQMKRLEDRLATRLLDRSGRRVELTEAGQILLSYAHRILDLHEEALAKLSVVEAEGSVRVGVLEEVALGPLVDLLTKFGRLCTKIRVELQVSTSWELARAVRENKMCLAVANAAYAEVEQMTTPLWDEPYVWAANPAYDFHDRKSLPLVLDPLDCPWAVRNGTLDALNAMARKWHVAFSSLSLMALQAGVRAGLGIGLIAQSAVTSDMRVLGSEEGLPAIDSARIALYRATEATSEAVDSLEDFLLTHLGTGAVPGVLEAAFASP